MGVAAFAAAIMEWWPMISGGIKAVMELFSWGQSALAKMAEEDRDPTEEEWAELNRRTDELRELLHSDEK